MIKRFIEVTDMSQARLEKLEHYAEADGQQFVQFDGWLRQADDPHDLISGDEEGDAFTKADTFELMRSPFDVRLLVRPGTSRQDVIRLLKKIARWINEENRVELEVPRISKGDQMAPQLPPDSIPF